ncbi:ATP-binding protein [Actinoplanes sp. NBRC 14428]|uniref:Anti-sigma regulatory factor (Ser/Thr protein kinase) n=1 Tax=Pseudosporangium ferrugineum TaxID=439699 RepID=A0A2T0S8Z6_9ACTN|nr:ATP-binding protein [Pseudosporangium ferrugineum]PRY29899.1 anti-sigma regulatory factor (Ser/Thr protein kinase) [Pseudosporangium ferrugineum]BCJ50869.1 ATP-binding protein [Actinoplanes sp. NBRC 14428]
MSALTARFDVPLGLNAPGAARRAVTAVLAGWGYRDETWLEQAAVVVSELVTNAVRHGGGCVELRVESHDDEVIVSVADGSSVVPRRREPDSTGGRGLALIEAMAERWGVRDHQGGKQVWVALTREEAR